MIRRLNAGSDGQGLAMDDLDIRAALDRHWAASDANDLDGEHEIYREDATLGYPQSGERFRGRRNIQSSRAAHLREDPIVLCNRARVFESIDRWAEAEADYQRALELARRLDGVQARLQLRAAAARESAPLAKDVANSE
jgi:hypothetical protein